MRAPFRLLIDATEQKVSWKQGKGIKKRMVKRSIAGIMTALLFVFACTFSTEASSDKISALEDEINQKQEEKEQTESEIDEKKDERSELNETAEGLKGQLNSLNANLTEVSNNLAELEERIKVKNEEIEQTQAELEHAKEVEAAQYAAMKKRVKFMYEKRDYLLLEILFGAESMADFLNRHEYIERISEYDREKLEEFKATRAAIEETEAHLKEEKAELDDLRASVEEEQSRYTELVNQTSGKLSSNQHEISETEAEMLEYERQLEEQKNDIARLQEELAEERRLSELAARSAWRDISEITFAEGDRYLLANLIYCEAGNQPYEGQVAVGAVVMNRVMSSVFPDTVVGVIYQNKQFSPVASGRLALALSENHATDACYRAADAAMAGNTTVGNCLFFRTPIDGLTGIQIGGHIFY